ncbi:O-Antigen ligase [Posidoniimonas polymericola]|uniref:O-Antigen ligase n=1 Tax=Posidoniimonas polymericola TaxID=2528002 RepID=A0A5C5XYK2_9BACT|nr:O-antigen ligase family protein [Posidoniimonas polymericola]TWT67621.1 O-Antigen ligase [Posidoniimonas polymericola]
MHSSHDNSEQRTAALGIPKLGSAVVGMSVMLCLMFMGMMHDFRSAGLTHDQLLEQTLDEMNRFEQDVTAAYPERKAAFVLSAVLAAYCLATAPGGVRIGSPLLAALILAALAWTCASWFWSIDQGKTARELVRITVYFGLAVGLAVRYDLAEICSIVFLTSAMTVAFACGHEVVFGSARELDNTWRLAGSLHPNPLGRFTAMVAIPALAYARVAKERRWLWLLILGASLLVIALTKSRTALACCVAGMAMVYVLTPGWRKLALQGAVALTVVGAGMIFFGVGGSAVLKTSGEVVTMGRHDKVGSLTGRLPLWEALLERSESRRVQGFGFGAFWTADNNESIAEQVSWIPGHAHSGYVETLIGLGAVGLTLMLLILLLSTSRMCYWAMAYDSTPCRVLAAVMVAAIINTMTEGGFALPRELAIFSMMFAAAASLRYAPGESKERAAEPARVAPVWGPVGLEGGA